MEVVAQVERGVQLDAAEVDRPQERRELVDNAVVDVGVLVAAPHRRHLHPVGAVLRTGLLPEAGALYALGIAMHVKLALAQVRQHDVGDAHVVVEQLTLRSAGPREDHALEVPDVELSPADLELTGRHEYALPTSAWKTLGVAESEAIEQAMRELYALPPGDFTSARDARVKELRADGDRDAAAAVKALRRPTVAAWALNQLARSRAKDVERLLEAGERLRSAQEELLGGGDRAAFQ